MATHSVVYRYPVGGITTTAIDANLATYIALTPTKLGSAMYVDTNGDLVLIIEYTA